MRALRIFETAEVVKDVPGEIPERCQTHSPLFWHQVNQTNPAQVGLSLRQAEHFSHGN